MDDGMKNRDRGWNRDRNPCRECLSEIKARITNSVLKMHVSYLALAIVTVASQSGAQSPVPTNTPPGNRYLLVVETSHAMQSRVRGVTQAVQEMLATGLTELRSGDTLGVWTFNDKLYAGQFPLQDFSPQNQQVVAAQVASFVQSRRYEKQGSLDQVLSRLQRLVTNSTFLTVILVTTGDEAVRGTPFDGPIGDSFKQWRAKQQAAQMPLITVMRAKDGQFTDFTVNEAPWPVEWPPLPAELQTPQLAKKPSPAVAQSIAEALLASAQTNTGSNTHSKPTETPVSQAAPAQAPEPAQTAKAPAPPPPAPITPPPISPPPVAPATATVSPGTPPSTTPVPTENAAPKKVPASTPIPPVKAVANQTQSPAQAMPTPFKQIVATNTARSRPVVAQATNKPTRDAASSTTGTTRPPQTPATNIAGQIRPSSAPAAATPKAQMGTAAPWWQGLFNPKYIWIAAGSAGFLAILTVVLILRARARRPFHISLITHTADKDQ
jgi:hypothetical protein